MADVNYVFLLSLTIILIGFVLKKLNIIKEDDGKGIAKLIINITLPALILTVIPNINIIPSLLFLPLISIGFSIFVLFISYLIFRDYPRKIKGIILMCVIGFNIGLFAYPLIEGIWGAEGLQYIALFDTGNALIIFGVCYSIAAIYSPQENIEEDESKVDMKYIARKLLTSPPLLAYIVALILNFSDVEFPILISDILGIISRANMALTLLLLGIYLNFEFQKEEWGTVFKILGIRYAFGLAVGIVLYIFLPFNELYKTIVLIGLILPIGMAVVPFAVEYGYNEKLVGITTNISILASFILMWIITLLIGV